MVSEEDYRVTVTPKMKRVLGRAVRFLVKHPEVLDMDTWISHDRGVKGRTPWCGTVACLVGTISILETGRRDMGRAASIALNRMGISHFETRNEVWSRLFLLSGWPAQYFGLYHKASTQRQRVRALAKRVASFLETGQ